MAASGRLSDVELEALEEDLLNAIADVGHIAPERDWSEERSLVEAGEPGVALENLCSKLAEYDLVISTRCRELLASAGRRMGLGECLWQELECSANRVDGLTRSE